MAILKDLIVQGTSRFLNNVTGTNITADIFVKSGGTSAQFLKADGSVDSNTYATSSSLGSYLPIAGGTLTGPLGIPGTSTASDTTKGINFTYSTSTGHIGMSTALGIYSSGSIIMRPNGASSSATGSGSLTLSSSGITAEQTITAEGFKKSGGTSAQFLKADGSVDSNTYITQVGNTTSGAVTVSSAGATIGTSDTTIATIGGVDIKAKIGSYAAASHSHTKIGYVDSRSTAVTPTDAVAINGVQLDFKTAANGGLGGTYNGVLTLDMYSDASGGYPIQLGWDTALDANNTKNICVRTAKSATEWNTWRAIADTELTTNEINTICV